MRAGTHSQGCWRVLLAALSSTPLTHLPLLKPRQMKDWLMEHGHEADVWALVQVCGAKGWAALLRPAGWMHVFWVAAG